MTIINSKNVEKTQDINEIFNIVSILSQVTIKHSYVYLCFNEKFNFIAVNLKY